MRALNHEINIRGEKMMKQPIVAMMYDFDNTLCTKDMQE